MKDSIQAEDGTRTYANVDLLLITFKVTVRWKALFLKLKREPKIRLCSKTGAPSKGL